MDLSKVIARKDDAAQYMIDEITHICKDFPTRSPGTEGEKQAAEYMEETLKDLGCTETKLESFKENPGSFFGWIYITITLVLCSIALYFVFPLASVIMIAFGLFVAFMQFGLYKKFVDRCFKEKTGTNLTAIKPPKGEVKRRLVFNGHIDAAWEWPVNYALGGVGFEGHAIICAIGAVFYIVISILYMAKYGLSGLLLNSELSYATAPWFVKAAYWGLLFIPFEFGLYFMWNEKRIVDGANDNLTGCYMGIAVLKYLKEEGVELENTELVVVNCGSEEAGLRGSKAWSEAHKGEWQDVPTFFFSYDTIYDPKYLMVNYRDLNGTVKSDKDVSDLFLEAAQAIDVPIKKGWVPPLGGATDNAAFCQAGFRSTGITGLNHKLEDYYHTRRDTYDNMNPEGLANCFAASVKALEMFDDGAKQ
ncbi:MAG: M28 family peptidase [Clostridia bacterium]|nr:M28 family peptidase [Clostridia bacterium]